MGARSDDHNHQRTQVNHVRRALLREFAGLIDVSDVRPDQAEQHTLTRSLAALAVRRMTDCDDKTAAASVIDGRDDFGIDAIAFGDSGPELILVQAKWSDRGTAGIDTSAALKLADGFRKIEARRFARFNTRFQAMTEKIRAVLSDPRLTVRLVLAVMGEGTLSQEVRAVFDELSDEFNYLGPSMDYTVVNGEDFWNQVRGDLSGPEVQITVRMNKWLRHETTDAFQGTVSADSVAQWLTDNGDKLFERNVRRSLGLTSVNQAIIDTLTMDPESFWSRNNGITILCSAIEPRYNGSRRSPTEPVDLIVTGASVVNGAQTVTAIHRANGLAPDSVCLADVPVRVICVPKEADELATQITRSTNTQNHMERRDFIALDPTQVRIREDFALSLDKIYVFKRGDMEPAPEAGCSALQAALALACGHRNINIVVRAKRDPDLLWEEGPGGAYPLLFGGQPSAVQIWRSVLLYRAVSGALHNQVTKLEGRAAAIAEHGNLIVAHLLFRLINLEILEDQDSDWDEEIATVPSRVELILKWLIDRVDSELGTTSFVSKIFLDADKCRILVDAVLNRLETGGAAPDVDSNYRPIARARVRSRPAVHVLIDAMRIEAGTKLRYVPTSERERLALQRWLSEQPDRGFATWVPERGKPLLWEADGRRYSPTGLVMHMWQMAEWTEAPVAVQGPKCWHLDEAGSLADLASQLRDTESDLLTPLENGAEE
ncbi:AIPR family protein [Actinokineospora soli]|uniref:AIPR family protein n=1 Tax=Actinokineospora soli TaxID=1048753 RepID=A0ABW2TKQ4_9PSEU